MNEIVSLVRYNGLKEVDAIVMKKRLLGMVDHYVLYMGMENNTPIFIANYSNGVKRVPLQDILSFLQMLEPTRILRFSGNELERIAAIRRAWSRVGERAYDFFANNCEHFVNWVHSGKSHSTQVKSAENTLLLAGAGATIGGLASKNENMTYIGLGALLLGALLRYWGGDEEE